MYRRKNILEFAFKERKAYLPKFLKKRGKRKSKCTNYN